MKRVFNWQVNLSILLIFLSALVYYAHYLIFRDPRHIFIYLIGDIAFVFIELLLVTIILHQLLSFREKKAMLKKLNMVIGAFYSEVGIGILRVLSAADKNFKSMSAELLPAADWTAKKFQTAHRKIRKYEYEIDDKKLSLQEVKDSLVAKRDFLLRLLENPNLLEHESFTNLLWAVFHLTEELSYRNRLQDLATNDYQHLSNDIRRVYQLMVSEWLDYMEHLQKDYPYLFSLALRTNPFDPNARVEIQ